LRTWPAGDVDELARLLGRLTAGVLAPERADDAPGSPEA
jgi:hypothetical protein